MSLIIRRLIWGVVLKSILNEISKIKINENDDFNYLYNDYEKIKEFFPLIDVELIRSNL